MLLCVCYAALETSCSLAKEQGPYETYQGSPACKGLLQHDMWGVKVGGWCHPAGRLAVQTDACSMLDYLDSSNDL